MPRIADPAVWMFRFVVGFILSGAGLAACAQQSWTAYVSAEKATVYLDMSTTSEVLVSLPRGASVSVYFALQSSQGSWCKISVQSDRQSFGFVVCSQIHRGQAPPAAGTTPSAAGAGNVPKGECADLVDQLIETTGIKARSSTISKDFFAGITADAFRNASSREREDFLALMQRDFGGPAVEAGVRQGLLNHCDPGNYAASLEVLHTPIGARMIKLETASTSQSSASEFKNYSAKLRQRPAPPERVALLQRLDRATGGSEFINDLVISCFVSLMSSFAGERPSEAQTDAMRAYVTAPIKQLSIWSLLFTYRSASDEDISQYTNLFGMEPLRQFNDTVKVVIQEVIDRQSLTAGAELRAYAKARRSHFPAH